MVAGEMTVGSVAIVRVSVSNVTSGVGTKIRCTPIVSPFCSPSYPICTSGLHVLTRGRGADFGGAMAITVGVLNVIDSSVRDDGVEWPLLVMIADLCGVCVRVCVLWVLCVCGGVCQCFH